MSTRTIRIVALIVLCVALLIGCGRNYTVIGRVVQSGPGLEVGIHEVESLQRLGVGHPVSSATVVLYHEIDNDGRPVQDSKWQRQIPVNSDGSFKFSDYAKPGSEAVIGIEVSAPGCLTQYATYVDYIDPDEQYFLIVMPTEDTKPGAVQGAIRP